MKPHAKRLRPYEVDMLGLNKDTKTNTYRLDAEQWARVEAARLVQHQHPGLADYCEQHGVPVESVSHYWSKGKHYSVFAKQGQLTYEEVRDKIIEEMNVYSPVYPELKRKMSVDGHLLVIDPADLHVGKIASVLETGVAYNSQIAIKRAKEGVQGILDKSSNYEIDQILFVIGNDILHVDTPKGTSTAGTVMDTDGMWYDNFRMARQLYTDIIEMLLPLANIHVVFNPSNHDYMSGFQLADSLASWFHNNKNVTFDVSIAHRKYYKYHSNLIGTTHGDGAKTNSLPILMAQEAGQEWATTKHRYIYTHHVHRKMAEDVIGIAIESLRTISPADSWHHRNGFEHNPLAVEGFIHNKEHGQVARFTHLF